MGVPLAFCLALSAAACVAHTKAQSVDKFAVEGWTGQAFIVDGKFRQCSIWTSAINNWDLGFSLDPAGELRLGLRNQKLDLAWTMVFDEKSSARIQIDQGPVLTKVFTTMSPTLVSTSLSDTDWEKKLPDAKLLRVNTGRVHLIHLNGIKEAWPALQACVAKHRVA